jgi:YD repeat-containing protein
VPNAGATRTFMWAATATRSNPQSGHTVRDEVINATVEGVGYTLAWDNNGNLNSRGAGSLYVHDSENRMISGLIPGHSWAYGYDAAGRRVTRVADNTTYYSAHAGNMEIADYQVTNINTSGGDPVWTAQIT